MKPLRNYIYCVASQKSKILFETQNKADNYIKYNASEILEKNEKAPVRSYYCQLCCGWHVTSNPSHVSGEKMDQRDQHMVRQLDSIKESKVSISNIGKMLLERMKDFDMILNLCHFSEAEDILELCSLDLDEIRSLSPMHLSPGKYQSKVYHARERYNHVLSLSKMSKDEQDLILNLTNPTKAQRKDIAMIKNIRAVSNINSIFDLRETIITCPDANLVLEIIGRCKENIESMEGTGSKKGRKYWIRQLNEMINERNEFLKNTGLAPISAVAIAAEDDESEDVDSNQISEVPSNAEMDPSYKDTLLSLLNNLDRISTEFEASNYDLCCDLIDVCDCILADMEIQDENTELIKRQLNMWKNRIDALSES